MLWLFNPEEVSIHFSRTLRKYCIKILSVVSPIASGDYICVSHGKRYRYYLVESVKLFPDDYYGNSYICSILKRGKKNEK